MMSRTERQPIIMADAGPLIRLAAAGLLQTMRDLNRQIVLVDRIEDEAIGDLSKPYAAEIAAWIGTMGPAIQREPTAVGIGVATLRSRHRTREEDAVLKAALRVSGELALREFLARWRPLDASSAVVLYEDRKVPPLFPAADHPWTLMTTRTFVRDIQSWGITVGAVDTLELIADRYDLKPALRTHATTTASHSGSTSSTLVDKSPLGRVDNGNILNVIPAPSIGIADARECGGDPRHVAIGRAVQRDDAALQADARSLSPGTWVPAVFPSRTRVRSGAGMTQAGAPEAIIAARRLIAGIDPDAPEDLRVLARPCEP
jgi:hypothetical protein